MTCRWGQRWWGNFPLHSYQIAFFLLCISTFRIVNVFPFLFLFLFIFLYIIWTMGFYFVWLRFSLTKYLLIWDLIETCLILSWAKSSSLQLSLHLSPTTAQNLLLKRWHDAALSRYGGSYVIVGRSEVKWTLNLDTIVCVLAYYTILYYITLYYFSVGILYYIILYCIVSAAYYNNII